MAIESGGIYYDGDEYQPNEKDRVLRSMEYDDLKETLDQFIAWNREARNARTREQNKLFRRKMYVPDPHAAERIAALDRDIWLVAGEMARRINWTDTDRTVEWES